MNASGRCQRERVSRRWGDRCFLWHWSGVFPSLFMAQSTRGGQRAGSVFSSPDPPSAELLPSQGGPDGLVIRARWPVRRRNSGVEGFSGTFPTRIARTLPSWSLSWAGCLRVCSGCHQPTATQDWCGYKSPSNSGLVENVFCSSLLAGRSM